MKPKILIVIGVALSIIIILFSQNIVNPKKFLQEDSRYITKEDIKNTSSMLEQNYTSQDLLFYCTKNESHIYNDICIRGLWQVKDICKNENFLSNDSICNDPKFDEFEIRINNMMQTLDKSLIKVVDVCTTAAVQNTEIQSCLVNMERIKNDCDEPHFYSLMNICADPRLDQFIQKYKNSS